MRAYHWKLINIMSIVSDPTMALSICIIGYQMHINYIMMKIK